MKKKLINLDECVLNALNLFLTTKIPKINLRFKKAIVIGSGNAAITGKILFSEKNYIFANESNYLKMLKSRKFDGCILISASGGKHSPIIAKAMKRRKIETVLITNNESSEASKYVKKTFVFPKNIEPYTYNTSTYIGMILGKTKEDPSKILKAVKKLKVPNLKKYKSFYIIIPEEFESAREMFLTKFDELFGPRVEGRVFTYEETKHAKTVVKSNKELFIGLGVNNKVFGENRLNFKLPKNMDYGMLLAAGYYIIGKIQGQKPPYFKRSIREYVKKISRVFGEKIRVIG